MPVLTLKNIYYSVSEFPLLDHVNFDIQPNERIALIGRNGEGKSTLLKIIANEISAESGEIQKHPSLKISRLQQDLPAPQELTVYEVVAQGLKSLSDLLVRYHHLTQQETDHDDAWFKELSDLQQKIEHQDGFVIQQRLEKIIQLLNLPSEAKFSSLSGGWRRRVALAQAMVQEPDILLLDEPTNHLDLTAIEELEKLILNYPKTLLLITHDRALLRKVATKIIELDRGKLTAYPADYDEYLVRKEQALMEEERANALFDKKLSDEEVWIRQGIKARRTRNEGRVRALKALREERSQRRVRQDKPDFAVNDTVASGKMMIQAEHVQFAYSPDKPIIKDFSFNIQRGDKIAIIGGNGAGKTTLVKLLIGALEPTGGMIKRSPTLKPALFDQTREQLRLDQTLIENVAESDDFVEIQGKRKHVIGYLGDFLFPPTKCRSLAKVLSGGEQNRLLLAKLFSKPANVLVLDEPTNDLDVESLEILEEILLNYPGTVIIISHDREFIDNVATHTVAFGENGDIGINVGGYTDWLEREKSKTAKVASQTKPKQAEKVAPKPKADKRSYKEEQELAALPAYIERLEKEISALESKLADPQFYQQGAAIIQESNAHLNRLREELANAYNRWEALE